MVTVAGLFQDMMDNFRELAETQLQCAVCSEVFVEATAVNCGHTFCHFCIHEWKKKKSNCPVCRTDIKQIVAVKVGFTVWFSVSQSVRGVPFAFRQELSIFISLYYVLKLLSQLLTASRYSIFFLSLFT